MLPRHSVIVITYNQEHLIRRTLDSLLCQKELLFEIIVSDDFSTDSTWTIIESIKKEHPKLIRAVRNKENLGIYAHIEATWSYAAGDIIYYLSGDDTFCDGLFENANNLIEKNNIDFRNESFTLYFDYKIISPSGRQKIIRNKLIRRHNPISLKIRNLISNRTTGFSRAVLQKFFLIDESIGIYADGLIDIQTQLFSKKNYYSPFLGSIYYSGIGISSKIKLKDSLRSYYALYVEYENLLKDLDKNDVMWLKFSQNKTLFLLEPTFKNYKRYFLLFFYCLNCKYGIMFCFVELKQLLKFFIKLFLSK
jgi:glycosyltransferase involved in cell wall biosynthesis